MVRAAILAAAVNLGTARISGILFQRERRPGDIPLWNSRPISTDSWRKDGNTLRHRDLVENNDLSTLIQSLSFSLSPYLFIYFFIYFCLAFSLDSDV